MKVAYLGPQGTFTHQAATRWAPAGAELAPASTVREVYAAVGSGAAGRGIVAIENTVEGYVVPSLDAIIASPGVVAVGEVVLDITFDVFARPGHAGLTEISAHPHALAQCAGYVTGSGLVPVPATSNAAACRDLRPDQAALGPAICGSIYSLVTLARGVEDFRGARTRFLALARRADATALLRPDAPDGRGGARRTMLAVTPRVTGPGVLARITHAFGMCGVNLSSLITRPLKAVEGQYVFVLTVDAAPWEPQMRRVLVDLLGAGDYLKTLGVLPARTELDESVHAGAGAAIPVGSVAGGVGDLAAGLLW